MYVLIYALVPLGTFRAVGILAGEYQNTGEESEGVGKGKGKGKGKAVSRGDSLGLGGLGIVSTKDEL